ncbi:flagellum-specific ATP synthase [Acetoanaerobium noterae]|jgi:flagellum-specific ATP synthase|uniref:Type 3 secretion system ATPase n=1 Tax=Acetoanaerobium noterae TaxID=745369 RepID=A0A1T4ZW23_9FIRM|nr:flagellar protein export ATPase FliI [Acetoanaerobium noterae]MBP8762816.1 flagellar protein export ATPase FliI [Acetoanaerobium sp.]MDK2803678.1 flagellum-specific synthase [Peptostreptococcaceae bacterium]MBP9499804.1 flagellar protein export ATPase FliI [Acetoanaerobium sp.]MBP9562423.1 flagellar protein export ATPase FliI [Acetoanaerobium sp.]SKB26912.1 flagellum-specific ATP synthase [Acetoanaerobium noterae]
MIANLKKYHDRLNEISLYQYKGKVSRVIGLTIESRGPAVRLGETCHIYPIKSKDPVLAEVVGFKEDTVLLMPLGEMEGIGPGSMVIATGNTLEVDVGEQLLGRILDGMGNPIDDFEPPSLNYSYPVNNQPPNPLSRTKITEPLPLGVKAIDGFLTCGRGQRIGIFAGSGVGKSTLLGMIARNTLADINVIALIGERGREVKEFIDNDLEEEGLKKSVVIVVTSDQPPLVRMKGALLATSIAEYFRDCGKNVVLMMDSLTRFSMAQREVGLAIGEPPVTKGYTPSVFAVLPKLLERAGNSSKGSITGLYTVLVDGDDMNEPIADAVRGILDGHIVLSRNLANKNHYPAIDILASVSRVMPNIVDKEHIGIVGQIKDLMATYRDSEDLINIGAYIKGTNKKVDMAIEKIEAINDFLKQGVHDRLTFDEIVELLRGILD